jgi:metal-sulfur cluster biosynthetic enzyme
VTRATTTGGLATSPPLDRSKVLAALATVRDPELDEPLTELGFVSSLEVDGDTVRVRLRLPTYFCAPNFAYLMVADAQGAVAAVPGVRAVEVTLDDHFTAEEINQGVAARRGFQESFTGLADDELDELRTVFRRKALINRQQRLLRTLLDAGTTVEELGRLRIGDLPGSPELAVYLERRAELGLDCSPQAPLVVDVTGTPIPAELLEGHLRFARLTAVSIEGNAGFCRGLLATRYGLQRDASSRAEPPGATTGAPPTRSANAEPCPDPRLEEHEREPDIDQPPQQASHQHGVGDQHGERERPGPALRFQQAERDPDHRGGQHQRDHQATP